MGRLFVAMPLPDRLRGRLREETDRLRLSAARVSWIAPENLHLTLRFLGEVPDADIPVIHEVIEAATGPCPPLRLVARGLGSFPAGDRPRVVWCGLDGAESEGLAALQDLHRALDRGFRREGFRPDKGGFRPHITLGRVRHFEGVSDLLERMGPAVRREFGHWTAHEVVLFDSAATSRGRLYTPVHSFALG